MAPRQPKIDPSAPARTRFCRAAARSTHALRRLARRPLLLATLALASGLTLAAPGGEASCSARSGPRTATLVELYTSEGCSSCPPADRWLSRLAVGPELVALAFHVDYWDRLGWADRFAQPRFTQRQHERSKATGGSFVYTPQLRIDGRDAGSWSRQSAPAGTGRAAGAALELLARPAGGRVAATLTGKVPGPPQRAVAWLALTESRLFTEVRAGENAGVRLDHDHVVRQWHGPFAVAADGTLRASATFDLQGIALPQARLAALVELPSGTVLQALALPLADCGS